VASEVDTKKVVDLVQQYHPNATDFHISATIPIGSNLLTQSRLLYVKYTRPDRKSDRSLVFLPFVGDPVPFDSSEEFIRWYTGRSQKVGFLPQIIEWSGGIAGVIALAIVAVLLWQYGHAPDKFAPPDLLSHAFEIILGYYFGSKVAASSSKSVP
jgi:hypothetical protein